MTLSVSLGLCASTFYPFAFEAIEDLIVIHLSAILFSLFSTPGSFLHLPLRGYGTLSLSLSLYGIYTHKYSHQRRTLHLSKLVSRVGVADSP